MLTYFKYFISYSFAGFLLETVFSLLIKGRFESRKCFLLTTLCPVYGLGAVAILKSTRKCRKSRLLTFITGMAAATLTELLTDIFYKKVLGAAFWDYSRQPFNLNGSICLKYSIVWGLLSVLLVYTVHPVLEKHINRIPDNVCYAFLIVFLMDATVSMLLLRRFKSKKAVSISWLMTNIMK